MKIKATLFFLLLLFSVNGSSQMAKQKKADDKYEQFAYVNAIKIYENIAEKGHKSVSLFQKLGNAYYFNSDFVNANKWYAALFKLKKEIEPEYYYRYSQTLKTVGNYQKAALLLEQFKILSKKDSRGEKNTADYLEIIKNNSGRYTVEKLDINSEFSDYGSFVFENQLIFSSTRETNRMIKRLQGWNGQAFSTLYSSKIKESGEIESPKEFSGKLDSKFNESTPVFSKDGQTMFFTRNNFNNRKKGISKEKTTLLKIYKATLIDGKWQNVEELPFSSNQYSVAHPALSSDGKTLYFVSDMLGSFGQSDLFKVAINEDKSFGKPENLGAKINTEGKETFPFISDDILYFSSDGHSGLGGLDIFAVSLKTTAAEVVNIGAPLNGKYDDFAFYIDSQSRSGFFSSNREGGKGFDDIYKFQEIKSLKMSDCATLLSGKILDGKDKAFLSDVKVTLQNENHEVLKTFLSNEAGFFLFENLPCDETYYIKVEKPDYETLENQITLSDESEIVLLMEKKIQKIEIGTDLGKIFNIQTVYFDLDKSDIREDAAIDLLKIVEVMKEYPNMKIEIGSHTDSRASSIYNENLSSKRAEATFDYLIKSGIDTKRIAFKGYGETKLLNNCADGVECSEEEHQQNRRSEFLVLEL